MSLVLCVATVVMWVRSYGGSDYFERTRIMSAQLFAIEQEGWQVEWTSGQVRLARIQRATFFQPEKTVDLPQHEREPHWQWGHMGVGHVWSEPPDKTFWNRLGFGTWDNGMTTSWSDSKRHVWAAPAWAPAIMFVIAPALWTMKKIRQLRRYCHGLCPACGYDLRATPHRCPECGTAVAKDPVEAK